MYYYCCCCCCCCCCRGCRGCGGCGGCCCCSVAPSVGNVYVNKRWDELANPGAKSPGSKTPGDSGTPGSPRALTVVSARKLEKLALNSGIAGGARKMTQNASPNAVTGRARRNNVQIQSAKRAKRHSNSKHQLCTLLHSAEWRRKPRTECTTRRKYVKFAKSLS